MSESWVGSKQDAPASVPAAPPVTPPSSLEEPPVAPPAPAGPPVPPLPAAVEPAPPVVLVAPAELLVVCMPVDPAAPAAPPAPRPPPSILAVVVAESSTHAAVDRAANDRAPRRSTRMGLSISMGGPPQIESARARKPRQHAFARP